MVVKLMDKKLVSRILGLLPNMLLIVVSAVILISLVVFILYLVGIASMQNIGDIDRNLVIFKNILFSLTLVVLALFIFATFYSLSKWIVSDEGIVVQPFNVSGWNKNEYNGQAIADSLIKELLRIDQIHNKYYKKIRVSDTYKSKMLDIPPFTSNSGSVAYNIANLGTIGQGPISFSIGQLMIVLKRLSGNSGSIITGSLQKHESIIRLVAWIGHKEAMSWEVGSDIDYNEDKNINGKNEVKEDIIPYLIMKLAFKISMDISGTNAKTCEGLMHFTDAINHCYWYTVTENIDELESSIKCCNDAIKTEKNYDKPSGLIYDIAKWHLNKNNLEQAEDLFKKANILNPKEVKIMTGLGVALAEQNKHDKAINCYDKVIKIDPTYSKAWNNKGAVLYYLKRCKGALKCYDKAIEIDPKYANAWNNKGVVLDDLKRYDEAVMCYDKAIRIKSGYATAWNNKGFTHGNLENYKKAIKCYDKAIKIDPKYVDAWNNKGIAYANLENYKKAIICYDKAIEIDPKYVDAWYNKGIDLADLERHDKSIECYNKVIKLDPECALAWKNKGDALKCLGKHGEAKTAYQKAFELDPSLREQT